MSYEIAVITPTKDRPEQLSLVIDCMNNQTLKPDMWVIVDDGREPIPSVILNKINVPYKYIHYKSEWRISTCLNSAKCFEAVEAKKYIFFDDDDYYPSTYIENFSKLLVKENEMLSNIRTTDYRLSTAYYRVRFKTEEQLRIGDLVCQWHDSAIMGEALKEEMIKALRSSVNYGYNDVTCWRKIFQPKKYLCSLTDFGEWSSIGLKDYGVGNPGTIKEHRHNVDMIPDDDNYSFFKSKLGEDWKKYEKYLGRLR